MSDISVSLQQRVINDTRRWLERAVIGLNLCPFAKAVHVTERIHYAVCTADSSTPLLQALTHELAALQEHPATVRETTLLMAPCCLHDFLEFNEFIGRAERLLTRAGFEGLVQLASFHPDYQFADADPGEVGNCTNRSPYATIHLLRESSIDRAVEAFPDAARIYDANLRTLRRLGLDGWAALGVGPSR